MINFGTLFFIFRIINYKKKCIEYPIFFQSADAVNGVLQERSDHSKSLERKMQPVVVVIGPDENNFTGLTELIRCFNEIKWKVTDLITALDMLR